MRGRHGKRTTGAGYSLVELLVAMVVGVMVLGGIYQLIMQNQRVYKSQSQLAETQMQVRAAMDVMARDIRQCGNDPNRSLFGQLNSPMPIANRLPHKLQVLMDLPRDCGGLTSADDGLECPSEANCGGGPGTCLDGDSWDIIDKDPPTGIDIGNVAKRGENEFGNGVVGDINPDEDVTYEYNPATGRITRTVNFVDTGGGANPTTEVLADYIEQNRPTFTYRYLVGNTEPFAVVVTLRGRTREQDPQSKQFKYFELSSEILLRNMQGGGI